MNEYVKIAIVALVITVVVDHFRPESARAKLGA